MIIKVKASKRHTWRTVYSKQGKGSYKFNPAITTLPAVFHEHHNTACLKVVSKLSSIFTIKALYLYSTDREPPCEKGLPCQIPQLLGNNTKWTKSCCIGYTIDLLQLLMRDLRFDVDVYMIEDGYYGSFHKGVWNGMIGDVVYGKADIAVAAITITKERSKYVDFTHPFMRQDVGIVTLIKEKQLSFVNWQFMNPLEQEVFYIVLACLLVCTLLLYLIENERFTVKYWTDGVRNGPVYLWGEGFSYLSGLTLQRDLGGQNPKKCGGRLMSLLFAFTMLVVMTTYTAVLTASKVRLESIDVFKGMKDPRVSMHYLLQIEKSHLETEN